MDASDETLLVGFVSGEPDASVAFIRRFENRVFGLALTVLHDRTLAEDVAQETFLRAFRHGGGYDPRRASVSTWLLRITRNLAIDVLRLRRPEGLDPSTLAGLAGHTDVSAVEDEAVTEERAVAVRAALARLPAEQARALLLAAYLGCTAEEISRAEGIPVGTAKTRIRIGLRKVRNLLAAAEERA